MNEKISKHEINAAQFRRSEDVIGRHARIHDPEAPDEMIARTNAARETLSNFRPPNRVTSHQLTFFR